jgi:hypothetical protein
MFKPASAAVAAATSASARCLLRETSSDTGYVQDTDAM